MNKVVFISIFVLIFIFSPFLTKTTHAQVQDTDVSLTISPRYPKPGEKVTATLFSYVTDLNKANIAWVLDGESISSGVGKKTFIFTLGKLGTSTQLKVDIQTIDRQSFSKFITIDASEVDMLWEAVDSYVPPFYKGKALVGREGRFKVVAMPNIFYGEGNANLNTLSYTWEKDEKGDVDSSGWGKNYFIFKNSYLDKKNEVLVKVSDVFGSKESQNKITLNPITPKIAFYEKNPILGVDLSKEISSGFAVEKEGSTVVAIPYFFSPKNISSGGLNFEWRINNKTATPTSFKNELAIKGEEGSSGSANIKVKATNTNTLFQTLEKQLNVVF